MTHFVFMFRLPPLPTMLRAVVGSGASVARRVVGREFSGGLWSGEKRGLRRLLALPLTWPSPYLWTGHFDLSYVNPEIRRWLTSHSIQSPAVDVFSLPSPFFDEFYCSASIGELKKLHPWRAVCPL